MTLVPRQKRRYRHWRHSYLMLSIEITNHVNESMQSAAIKISEK